MNHEYRMKFINESRIIEVKQDRNHEYPRSNDSASTPDGNRAEVFIRSRDSITTPLVSADACGTDNEYFFFHSQVLCTHVTLV